MWTDKHRRRRQHSLMTRKLAKAIPALYTSGHPDADHIVARVKLFSPYTGWRWYITEWDAETGRCFGLVDGKQTELGYFELTELAELTISAGGISVPLVERDLYFEPQTLGEIKGA